MRQQRDSCNGGQDGAWCWELYWGEGQGCDAGGHCTVEGGSLWVLEWGAVGPPPTALSLSPRSVSCRCRSFCVETWTRTTTSLSATLRSTPRWEHPTAPPTPQTRIIWTEMTPGSLWVCWGLVPCCPPTLSLSCAHPSGSGLGCCFFHPQAVV